MIGALWILGFTIIVGLTLYIGEIVWRKKNPPASLDQQDNIDNSVVTEPQDAENCCGLHLVCEKDSLSPMSAEILYYDDEELDRFIGRDADSYSPDETEEFRDILMTLLPQDVTGWARSITQRNIQLPPDVRDELLMLVNEQRQKTS